MENLADSPRSWPEDFSFENGNYLHTCKECRLTFIGHKSRSRCKSCVSSTSNKEDGTVAEELIRSMPEDAQKALFQRLCFDAKFYSMMWSSCSYVDEVSKNARLNVLSNLCGR